MIVVTGAAGFIGSNIVADLEAKGAGPIVVCDWFGTDERWRNLAKRRIDAFVRPEDLGEWLNAHAGQVTAVIHMGAISATTERDVDKLVENNINFTVAAVGLVRAAPRAVCLCLVGGDLWRDRNRVYRFR